MEIDIEVESMTFNGVKIEGVTEITLNECEFVEPERKSLIMRIISKAKTHFSRSSKAHKSRAR